MSVNGRPAPQVVDASFGALVCLDEGPLRKRPIGYSSITLDRNPAACRKPSPGCISGRDKRAEFVFAHGSLKPDQTDWGVDNASVIRNRFECVALCDGAQLSWTWLNGALRGAAVLNSAERRSTVLSDARQCKETLDSAKRRSTAPAGHKSNTAAQAMQPRTSRAERTIDIRKAGLRVVSTAGSTTTTVPHRGRSREPWRPSRPNAKEENDNADVMMLACCT